MTKQEQIEEMAIDLEEEFVVCGTLSSCGTKRCSQCFSKYLYEQGYRKLPDGATVLLVGKYNQSLDEKTIEYFIKHNEQIRKETAEKIFNDIFALVNNAKDKSSKIFGNSSDYGKGYKNSVNHFNEHILELAKQFGLEIKE